ncbi:zinc ribbon domain-containing protein [Desulfococcaceae bacterium HSG8]|nr:zinc ribbon domain-containing protein [Desulfococcaceae bacterium HSG8]
MPLFDYVCTDCGNVSELLVSPNDTDEGRICRDCGSQNLKKLLSAHSSLSGTSKSSLPGAGDTACCGSDPGHAGCAGPGSCCGKSPA